MIFVWPGGRVHACPLACHPFSGGCSDVRTYSPKPAEIEREWYELDADGAVLGRLAAEMARVLRGKHKPIFAPHLDTGDHVIIVNAAQVVMTSDKADKKLYYRHSGYPGGLTSRSYTELLEKDPAGTIRRAVKGMLPKGPLGSQMLRKLKVYAGPTHPHSAQGPKPLTVDVLGLPHEGLVGARSPFPMSSLTRSFPEQCPSR